MDASGHETADELRELPIPELLRRLSQETTTLVRQEIELAKAEVAEKGKPVAIGAGMFGAAGLFGLGAFGALTACFILLLSLVMPSWVAALIVAVIYGIVAGVAAMTGKRKIQQATPLTPEQTAQTVKEDVQWAKTRVKSVER